MTEHGITTSKADFWIHFHPLETRNASHCPSVYWYAVAHCREHITKQGTPIDGRSKDVNRTTTGAGYLIQKNSLFVVRQVVPVGYATDYRWRDATDREAGMLGERCVQLMVMKREIWLPERQLKRLNGRADQLNGCDCELVVASTLRFEIKTERVQSENLFVQCGENGHRVHYTTDGEERVTAMDQPFWERDA